MPCKMKKELSRPPRRGKGLQSICPYDIIQKSDAIAGKRRHIALIYDSAIQKVPAVWQSVAPVKREVEGKTVPEQDQKQNKLLEIVQVHGWKIAGSVCVLLAIVLLARFWPFHKEEEPPEPTLPPTEEPAPYPYVTAEQAAALCYTDSIMGEISWSLSDESLKELNRVLEEYEICEAESISQFLAQATVESGGGKALVGLGTEAYFQSRGYNAGTCGAGYLHLTHEYGQMAFATWMMKKYVPALAEIRYVNPAHRGREAVAEAYYEAMRLAVNLGLNVSEYTRIVYDANSPVVTGSEYIAAMFAWESAAYYWHIAGIQAAFPVESGVENTDVASKMVGGSNWKSRREAYLAFYPILSKAS